MSKPARRFLKNDNGAIAVVVALLLLPLIWCVGGALDFVRVQQARTALQAAADAAAMAAGADSRRSNADLEQAARDYFAANQPDLAALGLTGITPTPVADVANRRFVINVQGQLDTPFLGLIGLADPVLTAAAEVRRGSPGPVSMALVLDATNSMNEPFSGSTRMAVLKQAAENLVNKVMDPPNQGGEVGIVPFTAFVNLGPISPTPNWVKPQSQTVCKYDPKCLGCIVDGRWSASCVKPGCAPIPGSCVTQNWSGCMGPRESGYRDNVTISSPPTPAEVYPGVVAMCAPGTLHLSTNKAAILGRLRNINTIPQNTYIPSGLVWGWNMLTEQEPLVGPNLAALNAKQGRRVLILISDGASTVTPRSGGTLVEWPKNAPDDGKDPNMVTKSLCDAIKNDGISIYTVLIDVKDLALQQLMQNCASSPSMSFFSNSSAGLLAAFENIGLQLEKLRLQN